MDSYPIVYTSTDKYIIELERTPETITDENRKSLCDALDTTKNLLPGIPNRHYAEYHANVMYVRDIYLKTNEKIHAKSDTKIIYTFGRDFNVGEIVKQNRNEPSISFFYDKNYAQISDDGIVNFEPEFVETFYSQYALHNGEVRTYLDDGQVNGIYNFTNGEFECNYYVKYREDGSIFNENIPDENNDNEYTFMKKVTYFRNGNIATIVHTAIYLSKQNSWLSKKLSHELALFKNCAFPLVEYFNINTREKTYKSEVKNGIVNYEIWHHGRTLNIGYYMYDARYIETGVWGRWDRNGNLIYLDVKTPCTYTNDTII